MSDPDNPPAFPNAHDNGWAEGMSLRDWFAGIACDEAIDPFRAYSPGFESRTNTDAQARYAYADAMLAARKDTP